MEIEAERMLIDARSAAGSSLLRFYEKVVWWSTKKNRPSAYQYFPVVSVQTFARAVSNA